MMVMVEMNMSSVMGDESDDMVYGKMLINEGPLKPQRETKRTLSVFEMIDINELLPIPAEVNKDE